MNAKQTLIGEIISVTGNLVSVCLLDTVKPNTLIIDGIAYKIGEFLEKVYRRKRSQYDGKRDGRSYYR